MSDSEYLAATLGHDDGDGFGRLEVTAAANGYSGRGEAWVDRERLRDFAQRLAQYPLQPEVNTPTIEGGFGASAEA